MLRKFEVEIAMMQGPAASADLEMEHFSVDALTFFTHPMHPLAKKKTLGLADLADVPLIIREERSATHRVLQELKSHGVTVNVALRCESPDTVKAAVRRKMGVGVLFYNVIEQDIKRKDLKALKFSGLPKLLSNSYIVYSKRKPLSYAANDFLTIVRSMKTRLKNPVNSSETNGDRPVL
jgi:DNA-binding transcriptional LysR family regulator